MKTLLAHRALWAASAALGGLGALAAPAAAADVGVSVQINQPGVYGRVDIGRYPRPALVLQQPVWVHRPVVVAAPVQPVYLWAPPGHRRHWQRHCAQYQACGVPVYFVQDRWHGEHVMRHDRRDDRRDDRVGRDHDDRRHPGRG